MLTIVGKFRWNANAAQDQHGRSHVNARDAVRVCNGTHTRRVALPCRSPLAPSLYPLYPFYITALCPFYVEIRLVYARYTAETRRIYGRCCKSGQYFPTDHSGERDPCRSASVRGPEQGKCVCFGRRYASAQIAGGAMWPRASHWHCSGYSKRLGCRHPNANTGLGRNYAVWNRR